MGTKRIPTERISVQVDDTAYDAVLADVADLAATVLWLPGWQWPAGSIPGQQTVDDAHVQIVWPARAGRGTLPTVAGALR
jgi:hypothetical protein